MAVPAPTHAHVTTRVQVHTSVTAMGALSPQSVPRTESPRRHSRPRHRHSEAVGGRGLSSPSAGSGQKARRGREAWQSWGAWSCLEGRCLGGRARVLERQGRWETPGDSASLRSSEAGDLVRCTVLGALDRSGGRAGSTVGSDHRTNPRLWAGRARGPSEQTPSSGWDSLPRPPHPVGHWGGVRLHGRWAPGLPAQLPRARPTPFPSRWSLG